MSHNKEDKIDKDIRHTKLKIYALIAKQVEVLDHLEYSLDQKEARKNHIVYITHLAKSSYKITMLYKRLMGLQDELEKLKKHD